MSNVVGPPSLEPWFSTNARSIEPACSNERPRFGNEWGDMCNEDEIDIINVNNKGTCRYITAVLTTTIVRYFAIYIHVHANVISRIADGEGVFEFSRVAKDFHVISAGP